MLFKFFFSDQISSPALYFTVFRYPVTGPGAIDQRIVAYYKKPAVIFIILATALDCPALACLPQSDATSDQTLRKRFLVLYFGMESKMTVHTEFSAS